MSEPQIQIEPQWKSRLLPEFSKPYMQDLRAFLLAEKQKGKVLFPPGSEIFSAMNATPFADVKVVIIGQDPYHGLGQAHGMCFSVRKGVRPPPSLVNIYKELQADLGILPPPHGCLEAWAQQGVLLLNAVLTVEQAKPASHQGCGWEIFTDAVIDHLNREHEHLVFILWGAYAQKKGENIDRNRHLVITSAHPSPFSAHKGFFGTKPFSRANQYLQEWSKQPINWALDSPPRAVENPEPTPSAHR